MKYLEQVGKEKEMDQRNFFKTENKRDSVGNRLSDNRMSSDYPVLMSELYYRQLLLSNNFTNWPAKNSLRWIEGYANYINIYTRTKDGTYYKDTYFNPWEIVQVDFFGSFRGEMEYDHPALIYQVFPNEGLLVVIPMTSDQNTYTEATKSHPPDNLVALTKNQPSIGNLSKNSSLLLGQLKVISKHRVVKTTFDIWDKNQHKYVKRKRKIKHDGTKKLIDKKLAKIYSGNYIDLLESDFEEQKHKMEDLLNDEKAKVQQLTQKITELQDLLKEQHTELETVYTSENPNSEDQKSK